MMIDVGIGVYMKSKLPEIAPEIHCVERGKIP